MGSKVKALMCGAVLATMLAGTQARADVPSADAARSAAMLADLRSASAGVPRAQAILAIAQRISGAELEREVKVLRSTLLRDPADLYAKMYYGCGLLRQAIQYLANKNFMQAAESAKQGFFYVDEAAESAPDDWRLRYLRTRVDAFAPPSNGRCVIALKDTAFLEAQTDVPRDLMPMIAQMRARAQDACSKSWALAGSNPEQAAAVAPPPPLTPPEIADVLEPILKERR